MEVMEKDWGLLKSWYMNPWFAGHCQKLIHPSCPSIYGQSEDLSVCVGPFFVDVLVNSWPHQAAQSLYTYLGPARHHWIQSGPNIGLRGSHCCAGYLAAWIKHQQATFHCLAYILLVHHVLTWGAFSGDGDVECSSQGFQAHHFLWLLVRFYCKRGIDIDMKINFQVKTTTKGSHSILVYQASVSV